MLDGLEDQRPLCLVERNFRRILKAHLLKLLEAKRIYWKQRATIRWVKFGDKFFQSIASSTFRRNYIAHLYLDDGSCIFDHAQKAATLWASFKARLGVFEVNNMHFNLDSLVSSVDSDILANLDRVFSTKEIDLVVKGMESDLAPGPNGFNGLFMKKCLHLIAKYFYHL